MPNDFGKVSDTGTFYRPGPNVGHFAWLRRGYGNRHFSICGVTHTTAEHVVMDGLGESVLAPTQAWDALVCTSSHVRAMVERLMDNWADYLAARYGGKPYRPLKLPLIPLGVDCDTYAPTPERKREGAALRQTLGIGAEDVVVLFVGRLTHIEKANPLPMYLALEAAAKKTKRPMHLLQAGWFASPEVEKAFKEGAATFAPSVRHHWVDARKPEYRYVVWGAGDIFTSLSDNIQETFGLTPIEAQAAGLPVVVSDWDGYRDTVTHDVHGLTVPSFMPPPGTAGDIALRYGAGIDGYGRYCMATAQSIAIDIDAAADAYLKLIEDADLRRKMGEAGLAQARERFDWKVVIGSYQRLWAELAELRRTAPESMAAEPGKPLHPLRDDPFSLFAEYPTALVDGETLVALAPGGNRQRLAELKRSPLANIMPGLLLPEAELWALAQRLQNGPRSVAKLVADLPAEKRNLARRSIGWLAKMGLLKLRVPGG
jgi:glycosyltransferase involved in cell wall biosynthesis